MVNIPLQPNSINDWARAFDFANREKQWMIQRIKHASTVSQSQSKLWLTEEIIKLNLNLDQVALLGGWFAHIITPLLIENARAGLIAGCTARRSTQILITCLRCAVSRSS